MTWLVVVVPVSGDIGHSGRYSCTYENKRKPTNPMTPRGATTIGMGEKVESSRMFVNLQSNSNLQILGQCI